MFPNPTALLHLSLINSKTNATRMLTYYPALSVCAYRRGHELSIVSSTHQLEKRHRLVFLRASRKAASIPPPTQILWRLLHHALPRAFDYQRLFQDAHARSKVTGCRPCCNTHDMTLRHEVNSALRNPGDKQPNLLGPLPFHQKRHCTIITLRETRISTVLYNLQALANPPAGLV